ncbi:hypothetical protein, partial [Escherichia coli]|uniref:hypothetical protein n=1 Tax=Escherichia coli TaxID=562 RepID=UPI003F298372
THMPGAITVNYNKWFYSEAYRRELSRPFGPFTDKGLNFIPNHGGGSSFDGHYYQGIAQDMMVLDRYKTLMADKEFQENVLIDEDLQ